MKFQNELEEWIRTMEQPQKLLLHSCCAPCSTYVLEYLSQFFKITVFYYNPNITEISEYQKRAKEQQKLICEMNQKRKDIYPISFFEGSYQPEEFLEIAKGLTTEKEGGSRCFACFELRLRKTAQIASEQDFDCFTTTLTVSPRKNAQKINEIGQMIAKEKGIQFLPSDFKKKNGYKRTVEMSKEYDLYRQDYCGCIYSKRQREGENK